MWLLLFGTLFGLNVYCATLGGDYAVVSYCCSGLMIGAMLDAFANKIRN